MKKQIRLLYTDQILRYKGYAEVQGIIYKIMLLKTINSAVKYFNVLYSLLLCDL